jgi:hypothetical protein
MASATTLAGRNGSRDTQTQCRRQFATSARSSSAPREVRRALVYVLNNSRRHAGRDVTFARDWVESLSSARWFDGWRWAPRGPVEHEHEKWKENENECPVAPAGTWLLATGWRCHGLIAPDEVPGPPGG